MSEWKRVRLSDVCEIPITDGTHQTPTYASESEGIPFLSSKDVTSQSIDWQNIKYITKDLHEVLYKRIAPKKDDVLLAKNGTTGVAALVEDDRVFDIYVTLALLRPKQNIVYPKYLLRVINSPFCKRQFDSHLKGIGVPNLHLKEINETKIPLPPLEEQKRIAAILDKCTEIIAKRKAQLAALDELVKARFVEMFGDPETNPMGWVVNTLGQYITVLTDFSANGSYELLDSNVVMRDEPDYAIMVRTTDLESGNLETGLKYIDQHAYELLSKSKLFGGELIMNKIGSAGKIYVMPKIDRPASLGRNAFMFRFDDRINMTFLYALLTTEYGEREIQQYVRGAVTKTITKDATRSIRIIVPPIELQEQFVTLVSQVDKTKEIIQKSLEKTQLLFDSLMQEYFG